MRELLAFAESLVEHLDDEREAYAEGGKYNDAHSKSTLRTLSIAVDELNKAIEHCKNSQRKLAW